MAFIFSSDVGGNLEVGEMEDVNRVDSALNSRMGSGRKHVLISKTYGMSSVFLDLGI